MSTFLFDQFIFGPVFSRRLGISLGINLLPLNNKYCNFNCIYCECGWTPDDVRNSKLPSREDVKNALESKLEKMHLNGDVLDVITFAGNGEPTLHPEFEGIIDDTILMRNKWFPNVQIAVLSNATQIHKEHIFKTLTKIEQNILKLDSSRIDLVRKINNPPQNYTIEKIVENMAKFNGKFVMQTIFVKGELNGEFLDNSTPELVDEWIEILQQTKPFQVQIYTIARDTSLSGLQKISLQKLNEIGDKVRILGFDVIVSG